MLPQKVQKATTKVKFKCLVKKICRTFISGYDQNGYAWTTELLSHYVHSIFIVMLYTIIINP